jgi:hypothetical protein
MRSSFPSSRAEAELCVQADAAARAVAQALDDFEDTVESAVMKDARLRVEALHAATWTGPIAVIRRLMAELEPIAEKLQELHVASRDRFVEQVAWQRGRCDRVFVGHGDTVMVATTATTTLRRLRRATRQTRHAVAQRAARPRRATAKRSAARASPDDEGGSEPPPRARGRQPLPRVTDTPADERGLASVPLRVRYEYALNELRNGHAETIAERWALFGAVIAPSIPFEHDHTYHGRHER